MKVLTTNSFPAVKGNQSLYNTQNISKWTNSESCFQMLLCCGSSPSSRHDCSGWHAGQRVQEKVKQPLFAVPFLHTGKKKEECLPVWMETEICCRSNRFRLRPIRWVCIQSWRQGAYLCCPNSDNHVGWFHRCTGSHKITRRRCNLSCFILLQHNCSQEIRSSLKWKHVSTDRH